MAKTIDILEAFRLDAVGTLFYCTCDEFQGKGRSDIASWFSGCERIIIQSDPLTEFIILGVDPTISLSGVANAIIKIDSDIVPTLDFPMQAVVQ